MLIAKKNAIKRGFKNYFSETFRRRGGEDYVEFFTRGLGDKNGVNRVYPWMYMRVTALCVIFFAAFLTLSYYTGNSISFPVIVLLGGLLLNLPFTVLLYEQYPCKDFSFCGVVAVTLAGALFANVIIQVGYAIWDTEIPFLSTAYTALLEEFGKAVPAIVIILILKKRNPYFGFLIGACVGAGIAVSEDMGYIFAYSYNSFMLDYPSTIGISLLRGVTSFFTHIVWTGFIGWAFAKYPTPLRNKKFYGVAVLSVVLHFLWDCPVPAEIIAVILCGACSVVALIVTAGIVRRERFRAYRTVLGEEEVLPEREPSPKWAKAAQTGNISGVIALFLISFLALGSICAPIGYDYQTLYFTDKDTFVEYMQDGKNLQANPDRRYNPLLRNYAADYVENELVYATQIVEAGGVKYYYSYDFTLPEVEEGGEEQPEDVPEEQPEEPRDTGLPVSVYAEEGEEQYYYMKIEIPEDEYVYAFRVNSEVNYAYYDSDGGRYAVETSNEIFLGEEYIIAFSVCAAAVAVVGAALFTIFKIKARRLKNAEKRLSVLQDSEGGDPFGEGL